ncbi:MAG: DUF1328 domain-containing protein [Planctomycetaceae bacterium]|nr:DUF1328 domain-containing protein [Planctomycetaceae bacterium]
MNLLFWAIVALIVSLIAGGMGFTNIAAGAAVISRTLFAVFLLIAVLLFLLVALGIGVADAITLMEPVRAHLIA